MSRRSSAPLIVALFAAAVSCTGLLGFDGLRMAAVDAGSVTSDVSADSAPCAHRAPPSPPIVDASGGDLDLVFAPTFSDYGLNFDDAGRPRWESLGFDLDSRCTSSGEPPSCVAPPSAPAANHTDGVDGVDNALGNLLNTQAKQLMSELQKASGAHAILVRVRGYSGASDDDQVDVSFYVGLSVAPGGPLQDGNDEWVLHQGMLGVGPDGKPDVDHPKFHDAAAYVTGGVVVAHFPEVAAGPGKDLAPDYLEHFVQVIFTARLVQVGAHWELLDGMWGGRMPINDALQSMALNTDPSQVDRVVCETTTGLYALSKALLCSYMDISSGPDNPSSACDAISFGAGFEGKQARLGMVGPPPVAPRPCANGIEPLSDTCAALVGP